MAGIVSKMTNVVVAIVNWTSINASLRRRSREEMGLIRLVYGLELTVNDILIRVCTVLAKLRRTVFILYLNSAYVHTWMEGGWYA